MKSGLKLPILIAGGNGYVSGELLRLLWQHPTFSLAGVTSSSHAGEKLLAHFPHLTGTLPENAAFLTVAAVRELFLQHRGRAIGLFLATPHGATASLAAELLAEASACGTSLKIVDLSADFRFADATRYEQIYKAPHGAPGLQKNFACHCPDAVPVSVPAAEPVVDQMAPHIAHHVAHHMAHHMAHPGCFTTAVTLAAYPFFHADCVDPEVFAAGVTGSSGSGRKPIAGTHHPERNSNMLAYSPLAHRHEAEMRMLLGKAAPSGAEPEVAFVPHSGAFARGIHATLQLRLKKELTQEALLQLANSFYSHTPFVRASAQPPRLIDVAGTNRCHLGIAVRGKTLVVLSVIDNMIKGSAGGGIQWMNRLFGLPQETGLMLPGLGWY